MEYLLTDFDQPRWEGLDMASVEAALAPLQKQLTEFGALYGEHGPKMEGFVDIMLSKVSHAMTSLELRGRAIYGNVRPLSTQSGLLVRELIESGKARFGLRGTYQVGQDQVFLKDVFTWDIVGFKD